jgi:hypothetical protein
MRSCWRYMTVLMLAGGMWAFGQATQPSGRSAPADAQGERVQTAEDLLRRMLQPAGSGARPLQPLEEPPTTDRTSGQAAVAPGAPAVTVMREGSYIVDRIGRLTRSGDGNQMEFSFEADGEALRDPPVVILPSLELMRMENTLAMSGRDLRFRITGMVTEYRGRNYVLVEKAVVVSEMTQPF